MTLDEARVGVGRVVVYVPGHGVREDGVIVRVGESYVHVDYAGQVKATRADDLEFLTAVLS